MKILFVEDNQDLASNMFDFFEAHGHEMYLATDGEVGFNSAVKDNYDALILDWMLPGLDGITICKKLREAGKRMPILMLTARDSLEDRAIGLASGADDYVVKPFSMRDVEARLLALVQHD